jgi:hypothetical protein
VLGPGQAHRPSRRARREIEPLLHVALEALKAELPVEPALPHLAQDAPDLEVHLLKERHGRTQAAVELAG